MQRVRTANAALFLPYGVLIVALTMVCAGDLRADNDAETAKFKYKVALKAIENGDWPVAEQNLREAARLAPDNALIWYNLAIVESKSNDKIREALDSLHKAISLGLSGKVKDQADDLLVDLTYKAENPAFLGYWVDQKTNLMWTVKSSTGNIIWDSANRYCRALTLGGFTGWRLPSIDELAAMYDPMSDQEHKIRKPLEISGCCVWSSTMDSSSDAWLQNFDDGSRTPPDVVGNYILARALCVRVSER